MISDRHPCALRPSTSASVKPVSSMRGACITRERLSAKPSAKSQTPAFFQGCKGFIGGERYGWHRQSIRAGPAERGGR